MHPLQQNIILHLINKKLLKTIPLQYVITHSKNTFLYAHKSFQFFNLIMNALDYFLIHTMVGICEFQFKNVKDSLIIFRKIYDKYINFAKYVEGI
jgi:hypothetical protein